MQKERKNQVIFIQETYFIPDFLWSVSECARGHKDTRECSDRGLVNRGQ